MQAIADRREAAGTVTLVARDGKVVDVHASGFQDAESKTPMRENTIFRIASMTKPITSVAIMMLYEEGKLRLNDPVARFIPSFKQQRVAGENGAMENARRGMTIRDLLVHRSGLSYGFLNAGPVGNGYRSGGVVDGLTTTDMTLAEGIDKLAAQPLMSQPGAAWNYSLSTDVLGRVVEVASGQPFDVFLRERIFKPLGMVDTDFVVTDAKWSRLATVYSPDTTGGVRPMKDPESFGNTHMSPGAYYKPGKKYFSGGAGLTSTIRDYSRFALMLAGGGAVDGVRLLSPKSVELMSADHTGRSDDARPAARPWRRVRARVQRGDGPCRHAGARLGGHVRVERDLRHQLLGRSEGTARRDRDGPEVPECDRLRGVPAARLPGTHEINGELES